MPEFETPECDDGHPAVEMRFLESYDPMEQSSCGVGVDCTEWRKRWRYTCPECGQMIEVRETVGGDYERETVRENGTDGSDDPTSLSPVR